MSTASRVVKNTLFLYFKMGVTIIISLYSTRLILQAIGASDFGIFTLVGGAISMLSFLNSTMANATQRYMSYAEGEGLILNKIKVFNVSVALHSLIAVFTLFLFIVCYIPLFSGVLNIPPDRIIAAKIIYCCFIFSTLLTIISVPYEALLNAHENMLYYSIVGIIEALFKLMIAFLCVYYSGDKLILYGILTACVPLISFSAMRVYCHSKYEECHISRKYFDGALVKDIALFSGWNFLTAISFLFSGQGISIVLNHFFGTTLNAAYGIAQQVKSQLSAFAENMKKALNPVIVKNAGAKDDSSMNYAAIIGCKYSYFLTILFAVPLILEMPYVLGLWLKSVPEWTTSFCSLQLVFLMVTQLTSSLATSIYAKGKIKKYAIYKSLTNILPIAMAYLCFKFGLGPLSLYLPYIIIWGVLGDVVILHYAKVCCGLDIHEYFKKVLLPVTWVTVVMFFCGKLVIINIDASFLRLLITCVVTTLTMLISAWYFALYDEERTVIKSYLKRKIIR